VECRVEGETELGVGVGIALDIGVSSLAYNM
jgi:hypothetical protein